MVGDPPPPGGRPLHGRGRQAWGAWQYGLNGPIGWGPEGPMWVMSSRRSGESGGLWTPGTSPDIGRLVCGEKAHKMQDIARIVRYEG